MRSEQERQGRSYQEQRDTRSVEHALSCPLPVGRRGHHGGVRHSQPHRWLHAISTRIAIARIVISAP
jgi:hypothetical protein